MKQILLIDEDDTRRATRILLLEHAGYQVVTAERFQDVEGHHTGSGSERISGTIE